MNRKRGMRVGLALTAGLAVALAVPAQSAQANQPAAAPDVLGRVVRHERGEGSDVGRAS
jgi:hypothetical protein